MSKLHIAPTSRWLALLVSIGSLAALVAGSSGAAAQGHEIIVTITHIKALDKLDVFSKGDFYARVTIDGDVHKTPVAKQQSEVSPGWVVSQRVKSGKHDIKLEIFDKDISIDDPIDINRTANKRAQEFAIDTKSCRITGFSETYRCGAKITRSGQEKKAAEVSFKVDAKKR